jgi:hypothetical protein
MKDVDAFECQSCGARLRRSLVSWVPVLTAVATILVALYATLYFVTELRNGNPVQLLSPLIAVLEVGLITAGFSYLNWRNVPLRHRPKK